LINANPESIGGDQELIDADRKSICRDQASIDTDQKSICGDQKAIDADRKSICRDQESIDANRKSIGGDQKPIDAYRKSICIDRRVSSRSSACARSFTHSLWLMSHNPPDIPRLARAYRHLVLWFGSHLIVGLVTVFRSGVRLTFAPIQFPPVTPLEFALVIGNLVIFIAVAYYAYRTGEALGSRVPLLWVLAMVTPLVSIVALLTLSSRAAAICRQHGIPVGFFGPNLSLDKNNT
jgi:hypothetical protein